ncbi:MAG: DNA internalization-related competence protein ComEC/Rec2 [Desulfobulbus sp.]|nr:DNA internalization-related competence protein ComEC/Rec2 [Desulfobulbus sp.]
MQGLLRFCSHHLLVLVTLFTTAGASLTGWCEETGPTVSLLPYCLPLLLFLALLSFRVPARARPLITLPCFFLLGLVHMQHALAPPTDPSHIFQQIPEKTKATVVGTILTMPEYNGQATRLLLQCQSLLKADAASPAAFQTIRGKLQLTLQGHVPPSIRAGTTIMAIAVIDRLHRHQTPGAFNFSLQMASKKIYCSAWVQSASAIEPVYPLKNAETVVVRLQQLRFFPEQVRQHMAGFLEKTLPLERAAIYQALLVGSLTNIPSETLEAFKAGGIFHLLAISGLHFSLLGLFALSVLLFVLKRSQWLLIHTHVPSLALSLCGPILLFYAFVSGMNLPALRALITALLVLAAVLLRRQRSLLPLIAAAALLILAWNPLALLTASFQLSFTAVLAINLIYPRLPVFHERTEESTGWQIFSDRGRRAVQSMFLVSLAATAGTLPIMLTHFNRVSLIGPVMNLLVEPLLCLWTLPWGLVAFLLHQLAPDIAAACLHSGELGIIATLWLTQSLLAIPHLSLWTITPSPLEIGLYYCILWLALQRPAMVYRPFLLAMLIPTLIGSFTFSLWNPWPSRKLTVHYLDVGQGTATLVQMPQGKNLLIDSGGYQSERFDIGRDLVAPFLWKQRIRRLEAVIITHPHGDHYNGIPFILDHFGAHQLFINGDAGDEPAYQRLLTEARKRGIPFKQPQAGSILYQDNQLHLRCLGLSGLPEPSGWTTNDRSLVFSLRIGEHSFLFPADIGRASEQVLLGSGANLQATVLLAPHHGSRGSASNDFIGAVDPALIIVSSGRNRQGILPAPEHLARWREQKIPTLITAQDGTITLESDGERLCARTFRGKEVLYLRDKGGFQEEKCDLKGKVNRAMFNN